MIPEPPAYLSLIIVAAFPVFFVSLWTAISALLAFVSGYRSLLPRFADVADSGDRVSLPGFFAVIGLVSYRGGAVSFDASTGGLGIRVVRILPFHPPIRIPWDRVAMGEQGTFGAALRRFVGRPIVLDGAVTVHVSEATARAIEARKAEHGRAPAAV